MALFLELYASTNVVEPPAAVGPRSAAQPLSPPRCARSTTSDLQIRAAGFAFIGVAVAAIRLLVMSVHTVPLHPATPLECLTAFIGIVIGCLGNILLWEGGHINDECEVSKRWQRHR